MKAKATTKRRDDSVPKMQDNSEEEQSVANEDDRTYDDDADTAGLCQLAAFLMWSAPLIAAVTVTYFPVFAFAHCCDF